MSKYAISIDCANARGEQPNQSFVNESETESTHSRKTGVRKRNIHIEAGQCFSGSVNNCWHRSVNVVDPQKKNELVAELGTQNEDYEEREIG